MSVSAKKIETMADEWIAGDNSVRTSIQQSLRGSTGLNQLLDRIGSKLDEAKAQPAPQALTA
ncbi:hypothetical protein IFT48_04230 [Pseudomonas fluorescens]|uniref:hypothetical protein n=1 Tax=Pseudomonas TaxID=286 RepID=UPI000F02A147|nr:MULTISPECIES: hypothetical protein [Pseudomonas]MBD8089179.1 hypothetical protein [Pseudomonas fluorescens]MBD8615394.1 hypothetical protein [Pseudomonas putida]MBD8681952.1 hypothetical protein [Pseudomonas sp. CFBP 13719]